MNIGPLFNQTDTIVETINYGKSIHTIYATKLIYIDKSWGQNDTSQINPNEHYLWHAFQAMREAYGVGTSV